MARYPTLVLVTITVFLAGCGERLAADHEYMVPNPVSQSENSMHPTNDTQPTSAASGPSTDYFPLAAASRWEYDVEIVGPTGAVQKVSAVKSVKDSRQIGSHEYVRVATEVSGGNIRVPDQFYRVDQDGVRASVQGAVDKELLVLPADPRATRSWSGEAEPAVAGFSGETELDAKFQHRDHEFSGCVKVTVKMKIVEPSVFGRRETPVQLQRWFAPGIGLVRELRILGEEGKSNYMKSDSKLVTYKIGS